MIVLRSFGKFYGLAGLRLGFALGAAAEIAPLAELAGPWPASGPALAAGSAALPDAGWRAATLARLADEAPRLDRLAAAAGWQHGRRHRASSGSTTTGDAAAAQARLARHRIWSRIFPWSRGWLRLGLPGPEPEWTAVAAALR